MDSRSLPNERGLLACIVAVAAFVRLYDLSLMELRHDAAYWALEGQRIVQGGYWPLAGQQVGSVRVPLFNGPFLSYVTAIVFALIGPDPRAPAAVIALANVAGVWLTHRLGRRLYGPRVGLTAAALTAAAPWLVLYSRMLWPQSLFPLLVPLLMLTLWHARESQQRTWFLICGILLGIGVQLHLSLLPFVATSLVLSLLWSGLSALALLVAGCVLGYAPVLLHDAGSGFAMLRTLVSLPALHAAPDPLVQHAAKTVWNFTNVLSGQGLWISKLAHWPYLPSWIDWTQGALFSLSFAAAVLAIVACSRRGFSAHAPSPHRADVMLLAFIAVPTVYLLVARSQIHRHYFLALYPLPFVLIARGMQLAGIHRYRISPGLRAALIVGMSLNLLTLTFAHRFLRQHGGEGEYGTVLADKLAAVDFHATDHRDGYHVDLDGVQEPLPYVFLFSARDSAAAYDVATHDLRVVRREHAGTAPLSRIVETDYHPLVLRQGECVRYRRRGVAVVSHCDQ